MILQLTDAQRGRAWSAQVKLDFVHRQWSVAGDEPTWARLVPARCGDFDGQSDLTLWSPSSPRGGRPLMVISGGPKAAIDDMRVKGAGRILFARDAQLRGLSLRWVQQGSVASLTGIRAAGIELCTRNLPASGVREPPNCLEDGDREASPLNADGNRATGCGGFPGWYFKELAKAGFAIPEQRVRLRYQETVPGTDKKEWKHADAFLTGPTFGHREIVQELQKGHPRPVYIPFKRGSSLRPRPGDVFIIRKPNGETRHEGVFVGAHGNQWRTANGGQGASGYGVGFGTPTFDPATAAISGAKEVGYVDGWIDLEELVTLNAA